MIADELGPQLHDKATRGMPLDEKEQTLLQAWYAQQDAAETVLLEQESSEANMGALREQINAALTELGLVTHRVQELAASNDALREKVRALHQHLSDRLVSSTG